jgi:hypothetical protein
MELNRPYYQHKIQTQIPEFELGFWRGIDYTQRIFATNPSMFDALRHQIDTRESVTKIVEHGAWCMDRRVSLQPLYYWKVATNVVNTSREFSAIFCGHR